MIHKPVLLNEIIMFFDNLKGESPKKIADFTLGGGGHSRAILEKFPNVKIIAFDQDPEAIKYSKENLKNFQKRINYINDNFSKFDYYINEKLDGALLDLGISSLQIEDLSRGFSFNSKKKLDMRMNQKQNLTAFDIINKYSYEKLYQIFKEYGEIKNPKRVINTIIKNREIKPIVSCKELADIIKNNFHTRKKINPATQFFQALRIEVNQELKSLKIFLEKIFDFLKSGARLQIISFHSLEDRIVKQKFKYESLECICPKQQVICTCNKQKKINILTKKPIIPKLEEILDNPRARSAKLRVAEML